LTGGRKKTSARRIAKGKEPSKGGKSLGYPLKKKPLCVSQEKEVFITSYEKKIMVKGWCLGKPGIAKNRDIVQMKIKKGGGSTSAKRT